MASRKAKEYTTCCHCGSKASDTALFMCTTDECEKYGEIYCQECGILSHKNSGHKFDIGSECIKPMSTQTVKEQIKGGMIMVTSGAGFVDEQKYGELRRGFEATVAGGIMSYSLSNTVSKLASTQQLAKVVSQLASGAQNIQTSTILGTVADFTADIAKKAAGGALAGGAVMFGFELVLHSYRFWTGEIETWKEYGYHLARGFVASAGMAAGNWVGTMTGAAIGTLVGGPIGTIIGGAIGGIIGGVIGAKLGRKGFDEYIWKDEWIYDEQKQKTELIKKSLALFGILDVKNINNPDIFNEKRLKKKYRELAKIFHPDKNGNSPESHQQFAEINAALGVLLALLEKKDKPKTAKKLTEIKAITWEHDVGKLRKQLKSVKLIYIVNYLKKWKKEYKLERVAGMDGQNILAVIKKMNDDQDCKYKVDDKDCTWFVAVVKAWKERINVESDDVMAIANRDWARDEKSDDDEEEKYEDQGAVDKAQVDEKQGDEEKDGQMEKLKDALRQRKVLDVAKICAEYDEEYSLESLLEYRKKDILELIDEINDDDTNEHRISVSRKNKFAKTICEFAAK